MEYDDEGINSDFVEDIARELLDTGFDMIEDIPDAEKDDVLLIAFTVAVANLAVGFRILNPGYSHKKILDQIFDRVRSEYVEKIGIEGTGPYDALVN